MLRFDRANSFLLAGILLAAIGLICWQMGCDLPIHRALRLTGTVWPARIVRLSALGGFTVMGPLGIAAVIVLMMRGRVADGFWLLATIASGRLMVEGLKLLITRPRPPVVDRLELVTSWSFPSSHSAGTMMTCVALAVIFGSGRRWTPALLLALAAALIVGWSRVALAVHWPSDVLAGWGFGLLWLGIALRIHTPHRLAISPAARSTP